MEALVLHDPELAVAIFDAFLYVGGVAVVGAVLSALARPASGPPKDPRWAPRDVHGGLDGGARHEP
jgi:hypothetical protein